MTGSFIANIAVEGDLDEVVLKKVLTSLGIKIERIYGKEGKNKLRENVGRYNQAAHHGKWVILVDLNNDAECAPPFVLSWLQNRNRNLQLRVAVRAVEAWLLADRSEMARFLAIPENHVPLHPENEENPKMTLINLARRSKSKIIREEIVPREKSTARQGPAYTARLIEFAEKYWGPERAAYAAPSLKRSLRSLMQWKRD